MSNKRVIIITGPSGSGKSELEKNLVENGFGEKAVSTTTRPLRTGEVEGVHYHTVSKANFINIVKSKGFVEHVQFNGNDYGIEKRYLPTYAVLVVEDNGKTQIEENCENVISIGLSASPAVLKDRMLNARGDSEEDVIERIKNDSILEGMKKLSFDISINTDGFTLDEVSELVKYELNRIMS